MVAGRSLQGGSDLDFFFAFALGGVYIFSSSAQHVRGAKQAVYSIVSYQRARLIREMVGHGGRGRHIMGHWGSTCAVDGEEVETVEMRIVPI